MVLLVLLVVVCAVGCCSASSLQPIGPLPNSVGFLTVGDWGDVEAKKVADSMGDWAQRMDAKAVLSLGDLFYEDGVSGVDDPQFTDKFEQTFTAPSLQVPWITCTGNHDWYGGVESIDAELQYTHRSPRWHFPALNFTYTLHGPGGLRVLVASVDTWLLCGGDSFTYFEREGPPDDAHPGRLKVYLKNKRRLEDEYDAGTIDEGKYRALSRLDEKPPPPTPLAGPVGNIGNATSVAAAGEGRDDGGLDGRMLQWLRDELRKSDADWKIVIGHFTIYSSSLFEHGDNPTLIERLVPVLKEGGVDVYFNGHDHILQHIVRDGIHYIGSGAGARVHHMANRFYEGLKYAHLSHFGYTAHSVNKTHFQGSFHLEDGREVYSFLFSKPAAGSRQAEAAEVVE
ncbi:unnamed protein product [Vitrella brassicaformis CCMP3155]|uniref:Calcineurin-like phosphoesterase domain-containing protein n=2 Tax=Vitrella brassicaformis TaxID=1169539 RepID=A0A0G4H7A1_VITBC|nr:unnamed protein product [Vitrella brassicaformis CCMP3155]|eukprot:CEM39773.1 unnamed protein product [Vitrella brassicaformis CCMP3155]